MMTLPMTRCLECGHSTLVSTEWEQPALLRHGGYGATEHHQRVSCPNCGFIRLRAVSTVRPR
jgi:hypothetical protein